MSVVCFSSCHLWFFTSKPTNGCLLGKDHQMHLTLPRHGCATLSPFQCNDILYIIFFYGESYWYMGLHIGLKNLFTVKLDRCWVLHSHLNPQKSRVFCQGFQFSYIHDVFQFPVAVLKLNGGFCTGVYIICITVVFGQGTKLIVTGKSL